MAISGSLFDAPASSPLISATDWVTATLLGDLAFGLCMIAVALIGLMLMTGRLSVRDALRVVSGCFILLGAPAIAAGLLSVADTAAPTYPVSEPVIEVVSPPAPLPPANYDPYAGASLRVE